MNEESDLAKHFPAGSKRYRSFVGPPDIYDLVAAAQFCLLIFLGLREHHFMLDVGAGSLRGGRLFIPYLLPGRYYAIEPQRWLIEEALRKEVGKDIVRLRKPTFSNDDDFRPRPPGPILAELMRPLTPCALPSSGLSLGFSYIVPMSREIDRGWRSRLQPRSSTHSLMESETPWVADQGEGRPI